MSNVAKTAVLLGALSALLMFIGEALGGGGGMVAGFVFAVIMNFGAYWFSDKIVLSAYGAQEVGQGDRLYEMVSRLAARHRPPAPRCYLIPDPSPNAFQA